MVRKCPELTGTWGLSCPEHLCAQELGAENWAWGSGRKAIGNAVLSCRACSSHVLAAPS